jgi:excisionase family DNA binding protein
MDASNDRRTTRAALVGQEGLWDIPRLKQHTGLSESGIRRLVRRKTLPAVRIGRRILFRPSSIERFIEERETGGDVSARRGRRTTSK